MKGFMSKRTRTSKEESPGYVQTSLAGAICMGLAPGRFHRDAVCGCLNLLLTYPGGCRASCSYCGLAGNRNPEASATFIRVKWPVYPMSEIIFRLQQGTSPFRRACVSMLTHHHALEDACIVVRQLRRNTDLPVSGLISPTVMKGETDLEKIRDAGADRVGVAVDAVTPELFEQHRGKGVVGPHRWEIFLKCMEDAVKVFGPYKVGVHLIVGLGETEQQMVAFMDMSRKMKITNQLFSFFPESGSVLEKHPRPDMDQYRRIQLARYLIDEGLASIEAMRFSDDGRLVDFGLDVKPLISLGTPFMTSGCPGKDGSMACNRPFGNERAGEPMRNYPFIPNSEDIAAIHGQFMPGDNRDGGRP
jgi:lipoyl synthase